jgi:hypothetical protein
MFAVIIRHHAFYSELSNRVLMLPWKDFHNWSEFLKAAGVMRHSMYAPANQVRQQEKPRPQTLPENWFHQL